MGEDIGRRSGIDRTVIAVIVMLLSIIFFGGGVFVGFKHERQHFLVKDSEHIMLKIPKTRAELENQYLLNKAQGQILDQMLKWDMYKEQKEQKGKGK